MKSEINNTMSSKHNNNNNNNNKNNNSVISMDDSKDRELSMSQHSKQRLPVERPPAPPQQGTVSATGMSSMTRKNSNNFNYNNSNNNNNNNGNVTPRSRFKAKTKDKRKDRMKGRRHNVRNSSGQNRNDNEIYIPKRRPTFPVKSMNDSASPDLNDVVASLDSLRFDRTSGQW